MNRTAMRAERHSSSILNTLAVLAILGYMLYNVVVLYPSDAFAQLSSSARFRQVSYKGEAPLWIWMLYLSA